MYNFFMKRLNMIIVTTLALLSMSACSTTEVGNPSQNDALNSVTTSGKNQKTGAIQNSLNNWLKDDWTPSIEKDEEIQKKYKDKNRDFTLQEYVDKSEVYVKDKNTTLYNEENSHSEKMKSMPVIGN